MSTETIADNQPVGLTDGQRSRRGILAAAAVTNQRAFQPDYEVFRRVARYTQDTLERLAEAER